MNRDEAPAKCVLCGSTDLTPKTIYVCECGARMDDEDLARTEWAPDPREALRVALDAEWEAAGEANDRLAERGYGKHQKGRRLMAFRAGADQREAIEDNVARSYRDLLRQIQTALYHCDEGLQTPSEALREVRKVVKFGLDL